MKHTRPIAALRPSTPSARERPGSQQRGLAKLAPMPKPSNTTLNQETLRQQPASTPRAADLVPTLTIVLHSDLLRVGERAPLLGALVGARVPLCRLEPKFQDTQGKETEPLRDAYLRRHPVWLWYDERGLRIERDEKSDLVRVDGHLVKAQAQIARTELERGVWVELGERVLLLAHLSSNQPTPHAPSADKAHRTWNSLLGASDAMQRLRQQIRNAASHARSVILLGESGSGKELVARAIHEKSGRKDAYVRLNMAAIPEDMAEAELFGYKKGAFTGATQDYPGAFRLADDGTLFLDEVGDMLPSLQAKLLRALETGEIQPLGERTTEVKVRVIAATDADLQALERSGRFKLPLWHRLAGDEIRVPALRERPDDLARLWVHFLKESFGEEAERWLQRAREDHLWIPTDQMLQLYRYAWPGNVRELKNLAGRVASECVAMGYIGVPSCLTKPLAPGQPAPVAAEALGVATAAVSDAQPRPGIMSIAAGALEAVPSRPAHAAPSDPSADTSKKRRRKLSEIDDELLTAALRDNGWRIGKTARQLLISKTSLYVLMEKSPSVRKAADIAVDELRVCQARHGGKLEPMAADLRVSQRALRLHMTHLGVSGQDET